MEDGRINIKGGEFPKTQKGRFTPEEERWDHGRGDEVEKISQRRKK